MTALRRRVQPRGAPHPGLQGASASISAGWTGSWSSSPSTSARRASATRRDSQRTQYGRRRARALVPRRSREPTRRSAAWRPRTRPARRRFATARCVRTCSRSRRCFRAGRAIRTGAKAPKTSAGYDVDGAARRLEGTLARDHRAHPARLHGIPEHVVALRIRLSLRRCGMPGGRRRWSAPARRSRAWSSWTPGRWRRSTLYRCAAYPGAARSCSSRPRASGRRWRPIWSCVLAAVAGSEGATEVAHERDPPRGERTLGRTHPVAYAVGAACPGRTSRDRRLCARGRARGSRRGSPARGLDRHGFAGRHPGSRR